MTSAPMQGRRVHLTPAESGTSHLTRQVELRDLSELDRMPVEAPQVAEDHVRSFECADH